MRQPVNLISPEFRANPSPFYARLRNEPIQQVEPGGLWAISRYEDVQFALKNPKLFTSTFIQQSANPEWLKGVGNPLSESILAMDPPQHTRMRALVTHAFTQRTIAQLEARIRTMANELTEDILRQGEVDFVQAFALPLPAFVIGELLGLSAELRPKLRQWSDVIVSIAASVPESPERIAYVRSNLAEFQTFLREVFEDRKARPREDLISGLLAAEVEGRRLTDPELMAFGTALLVAGLETTVHLLSQLMVRTAQAPELFTRLRAEPALIPAVVEEVVRLDSPVLLSVRLTTQEVELGGVKLPAHVPVVVLIGSANRDERQFERAEELVLDRRTQHIGFGYGVHFCLGAPLARMESRIALETLTARCQGFALTGGELKWNTGFGVRGPAVLPVRAIP
ncbi:cytochrome P450 [Archangium gephyra]|uniref:cytochrome P450 n=1 Tax=Archangium gephyra TaxID=48 RepID=UPI003B76D9BD